MPAKKIKLPDPKWEFGEAVYLKVDADSAAGIITGYTFRPGGEPIYSVSWQEGETEHFECELTDVRTFGVTTEDE